MLKVKLTTIGNSVGIILQKETLTKMKVSKGDTLFLAEEPEGYSLLPYHNDFKKQIKIAEGVMNKYRNTLHELANDSNLSPKNGRFIIAPSLKPIGEFE